MSKQDTEGNELAGATLELYRDNGATVDDFDDPEVVANPEDADELVASCVTDPTTADDPCSFGDIQPGTYWAVERIAPEGYELREPNVQKVTAGFVTDVIVPFVNPRIPFWIDVTPETDVNPLDNSQPSDHLFTVKLWDGEWNSTTERWDRTPADVGETISLTWNAPDADHPFGTFSSGDPTAGTITDINGTTVDTTGPVDCHHHRPRRCRARHRRRLPGDGLVGHGRRRVPLCHL